MNTLKTIKTRKSVRSYLDKEVEFEKIQEIVNAGNMAAKAGKVYFNVVSNKEILDSWSKAGRAAMQNSGNDFLEAASSNPDYSPIYNAPVAVVISAEKSDDTYASSLNVANVACAGENMLLAATELGLGSCYLVSATLALNIPEIKESIELNDNLEPLCVIIFGYSDDIKPHTERQIDSDNIKYVK